MKRFPKNKYIRLYGVINPIDWDKRGHACSFSLYCADRDEIVVDSSRCFTKLKRLVNKPVVVTGVVGKDIFGETILRPRRIKQIKSENFPTATVDFEEYPLHLGQGVGVFRDNGYFDTSYSEAI